MSTSCLTSSGSILSYCMSPTRVPDSQHQSFSPLPYNLIFMRRVNLLSSRSRNNVALFTHQYDFRRTHYSNSIRCASFAAKPGESPIIFPRINIKDPYQQLGISREASEEEIQAARNYLVNKYAAHPPSVDAIESAHNKIIMQSFYNRRNPKIDLKKKASEFTQSSWFKAITSKFEVPSMKFILMTAIAFIAIGAVTVFYPTDEGPTVQVALSLLMTIYFIHDRLKNWFLAVLYGSGAFMLSWLLGTLLLVSVIPPVYRGPMSLEVNTSLLSYICLWFISTYVKRDEVKKKHNFLLVAYSETYDRL